MVLYICSLFIVIVLTAILMNAFEDYNKGKRMYFHPKSEEVGFLMTTLIQNNTKYNFLLDTGSTYSIINSACLNQLSYSELPHTGTVFGMEGNEITTSFVEMNFTYNNTTINNHFQVIDLSNSFGKVSEEDGIEISGVLGNDFFQNYKCLIDYRKEVIYYKEPVSKYDLPSNKE